MQHSADLARPKYRADIDGLRGIAVLGVVAFHAFPGLVKAGFIGVDVFFVISGFLITTIILGTLERDRFNFREFYARRIRRIFPALIVVLTAVLVVGWFTLVADEYQRLGQHVLGGATFTSNFVLMKEAGYFDIASERKILLHLWSLAIEEQFYLFFPLVMWAAWKRRKHPLAAIGIIGLASFAWNVLTPAASASLDFYSPQTRVWELMVGAALACLTLRPPAWWSKAIGKAERWLERDGRKFRWWPKENALGHFCSIVGAYLLGFGALFIARELLFPGWWALLPTLGAALLIFGGAGAWINRRLLSHRVLVWFGLISFPLYLWHWPLLSFARILEGEALPWTLRAALVAASIVLAWLTYRFIERPLRFGRGVWTVSGLVIPLAALGIMGFSVAWAGGFGERPNAHRLEEYLASVSVATGENSCVKVADPGWFCKLGVQTASPAGFVFGDSHAGSLLPAFAKIAHETGGSFLYSLTKACGAPTGRPVSAQRSRTEDPCLEDNEHIFEYVRDHRIPSVFIIFRWSNYDLPVSPGSDVTQMQAWLDQTVAAYRKIGVHVYLFDDNPLQRMLPMDALRRSRNTDEAINRNSVSAAEYVSQQGRLSALLSRYAGGSVTVMDFTDAYCGKDICPLAKDGEFLYGDLHHLSPDGALLVYPDLKKTLEKDEGLTRYLVPKGQVRP